MRYVLVGIRDVTNLSSAVCDGGANKKKQRRENWRNDNGKDKHYES